MKVDFYLLPHENEAVRLNLLCRLAQKANTSRKAILILCEDNKSDSQRKSKNTESKLVELKLTESKPTGAYEQIDRLLWTFQTESFLVHERLMIVSKPQMAEPYPPITYLSNQSDWQSLGSAQQQQQLHYHDIQIVLDATLSEELLVCPRILLISDQQPERLQVARQKYRAYQDHPDYTLTLHRLN